jgi:DNA-directed RNA polymerase beta subunit
VAKQPKLYQLMASADERRERLREHALAGMKNVFPIIGGDYTLDVEDFEVGREQFSYSQQKKAILEGSTLVEPVKAKLILKDKEGKVIDRSKRTVLHLPYFTERHTFIVGGNDYSVANQVRIKPGVYTRQRENGQLEAQFNLARGRNFRLSMDPEKGIFYMEYGSSKIPLYIVMSLMGATDTQMRKQWGMEVTQLNKSHAAGKEDRYAKVLYTKLVPGWAQTSNPSRDEIKEAVGKALEQTNMDPRVTKITLGQAYDRVEGPALLRASQKLLNVYNDKEAPDDRDSLAFKTLHTAESFIKERIEKDAKRDLHSKVRRKLRQTGYKTPTIKDILPMAPFTKPVHNFLTTSALSATPMQINPVEVVDSAVKVTSLGEGGISSTLAVPSEARDVHASHMGILDPVRTPESGKAGIDIRATIHTARDDNGDMYAPLMNKRTGKVEYVRADKMIGKVVAFPNQSMSRKRVDVLKNNRVQSVAPSQVDYIMKKPHSMYSPTTNLVPFLESAQGNRNVMGAKMQTQALPLKERELPFVRVRSWHGGADQTVEKDVGALIAPVAPVSGTIEKIDNDYVYIRKSGKTAAAGDNLVKVPISNHFPLMSKTFVHDEINVKPGQKVTAGQALGDNNFTRNGELALGKNMKVGYMPYYGYNSNDAIVVSSSAAKKLTSLHMYKESVSIDPSTVLDKEKHRAYYGTRYNAQMYNQLDKDGVAKKGATIEPGGLVIAALSKTQQSSRASMLGQLHKSLVKPFSDVAVTWDHDHRGEIIDVSKTGRQVTVTVRTEEPASVGDKVAGRYGNKGVISKIIPDERMVQDAGGEPIDMLLTSAGIITRINPNQILETAVSKVAEKTGKPVIVAPFEDRDNVKWAKDLLKKHNVKDKETVFDPVSGKKIPNIHVGRQYTYKLFKSTDTNYAGRGIGPGYDTNLQPSKGGDEGAKSIGKLGFNALIAHNARSILREAATVKGQRNDEYWRRVQLGLPAPTPSQNFAFDKFTSMLNGAGVRVHKKGTQMTLAPLTDRDIDAMASGEIKNARLVKPRTVRGMQQLVPETGGLFDPRATGGLDGDKFSKMNLLEPVVNPVFEEPARRLLDMSSKEFQKVRDEKGAAWVKQQLNKLDLNQEEQRLKQVAANRSGSTRDDAVKRLKYIRALKAEKLSPGDAYVLTKIPVVPPKIRPVMPNKDGTTLISDVNYLYRDVALANEALNELPEALRTPDEMKKQRAHLHNAVSALFGLRDPVSPQNQGRGVKGHISQITGTSSPKAGFFQRKMLSRRQDLSGRGTIAPDMTLSMDEIGIPEDMAWKMYEPFVVRKLVQQGFSAVDARKRVKSQDPAARRVLDVEVQERPVLFNRAPTLHRYNMISAYPKLIPGKTIRINPFAEKGMNADYDGDTVQIHVPIEDASVKEAKGMTLSNLIFGDKSKQDLMVFPAHEALIGTYLATRNEGGPLKKFKTKADAMAAYRRGEIDMSTRVKIGT